MSKSSLRKRVTTTVFLASIATGCTTISGVVEEVQFPRDTAIIIGEYHYLVSIYKCAEARNINEDGVIDCYAADGSRSASVAPVGDLQLSMFKKYVKFAWASEEHQAYLYNIHYQGGKERIAANLVNSAALVYSTVNLMKEAKYSTYNSGGDYPKFGSNPELNNMSMWDAREYSIANWKLHNANLYKLGGGITSNHSGIYSKKIGDLTFYSDGTRSYQTGNSIYNTGGKLTKQITDSISYSTNGVMCMDIGNITRCR